MTGSLPEVLKVAPHDSVYPYPSRMVAHSVTFKYWRTFPAIGAPPVAASLTRPPKAYLVLAKIILSQKELVTELSMAFWSNLVYKAVYAKKALTPVKSSKPFLIAS